MITDNGWMPITSAPKKIDVFIGCYIDGVWEFGRSKMVWEHGNELAGEYWSGWLWAIDDCDDSVAECPTHWMPLPKPPEMTDADKQDAIDAIAISAANRTNLLEY